MVRDHSQEVTAALKKGATRNDLLERLQKEEVFSGMDFEQVLDRTSLVGRSPEQVDEFLAEVVGPIRRRYPESLGKTDEVTV